VASLRRPASEHGAASIPGSEKIPAAPRVQTNRRQPQSIRKGVESDRDIEEDRYEFESGFIAVASRQPHWPVFFLHLIACARGGAAFVLIRGTRRNISRTRSFAHANHRQRDDPV